MVQDLLLSWRALKKLGGKFSFCLFLHLLHLYLTGLDAASLRGRRGRCARTPSGSCARFYYITRGFLISGGEKKLAKSDHGAMKAAMVDLVPDLLLSWRALKKLGGKFSFCLFLHLLHLYLTAFDAASLRGRRGRCDRIPSGSCARFYYITRGFLMSGAKKLGKSDYFVTYGLSLRPWRLVSHFNISI